MELAYERCGNCERRGAYIVAGRGVVRCKYCAAADECRSLHPSNLAAAAAGLRAGDTSARGRHRTAAAGVSPFSDAEVRMEGAVLSMDLATIGVLAGGRAKRHSPAHTAQPAPVVAKPASPGGPVALVVDDDPLMRALITATLERGGITVVKASNGEEACAAAAAKLPDIVLVDLSMPGMDGLEVVLELRRRGDMGIIVVSGRSNEGDRVVALELGADDYLAKPFAPAELTARVRVVLARRAPRPVGTTSPAEGSMSVT